MANSSDNQLQQPMGYSVISAPLLPVAAARAPSSDARTQFEASVADARIMMEEGEVIASSMIQHPKILSDWNFSAFVEWCGREHPAKVMPVLRAIHIVDHTPPPDVERMLRVGTLKDVGPVARLRNGNEMAIPRKACIDTNCPRCAIAGGYKFQWLGPWTCKASMDSASAQQARIVWRTCRACSFCSLRLPDAGAM